MIFLNQINVFVVHFYWTRLIQKTGLQLQVEGRKLTGREKKGITSERTKVSLNLNKKVKFERKRRGLIRAWKCILGELPQNREGQLLWN